MIDFSKYNVRIDYAKNIYVIEDFKTKGGRRNKKGGSSPPCCNSTTRIMNTTHTNSTTKKEINGVIRPKKIQHYYKLIIKESKKELSESIILYF